MARLEATIGKEEGRHRLLVRVGANAFAVGADQSVPRSVSRAHCSLTVDFSDDAARRVTMVKIKNLKAQNVSAEIAGSGDIECHATDNLKVRTAGSGSVGYKGDPKLDVPKRGYHKL